MYFASNKDNHQIGSGHIGFKPQVSNLQSVEYLQCDGDELTKAESIIGRKVPGRVYTFCGNDARTILANWDRS